jgi:hypothetical protein
MTANIVDILLFGEAAILLNEAGWEAGAISFRSASSLQVLFRSLTRLCLGPHMGSLLG